MTVPEIPEVALAEFLADLGNSTLDLTTAMARCTKAMGLQHSVAYLADLQQRQLTPLNDLVRTLPIDDSLAGWTYRTQSLRVEKSDFGGTTAWLPLVDGAERLGVLAVRAPALDALHEMALEPGDRVLMFTDGVTEARTMDGGGSVSNGSPTTSSGPPRQASWRRRHCGASSRRSWTPRKTVSATTRRSSCSNGGTHPGPPRRATRPLGCTSVLHGAAVRRTRPQIPGIVPIRRGTRVPYQPTKEVRAL
ncbi:SpoIIE family protein phosphatase [Streptomyces sp. NPDC127172]|uniref:SpoIIE family protein phosphatase n=1 Tax=Streptomyces sp. NPDC127172 TaxID=3345382 RepID=UPI00363202D3